jgi:hypothetical protein
VIYRRGGRRKSAPAAVPSASTPTRVAKSKPRLLQSSQNWCAYRPFARARPLHAPPIIDVRQRTTASPHFEHSSFARTKRDPFETETTVKSLQCEQSPSSARHSAFEQRRAPRFVLCPQLGHLKSFAIVRSM